MGSQGKHWRLTACNVFTFTIGLCDWGGLEEVERINETERGIFPSLPSVESKQNDIERVRKPAFGSVSKPSLSPHNAPLISGIFPPPSRSYE
jgi:hypothetical protein